jgi:hypothetical protein
VQWGAGGEVRVSFTYGWRPTNELQVFALQGDVSPTAPNGSTFAFQLVGVQMRQWGKTIDGYVKSKALEVTTIVALPMVTSSIATRLVNASVGTSYNVYNISATCPVTVRTFCEFKSVKIYSDADGFSYGGNGTVSATSPQNYVVELNHSFPPGMTVSWSFYGTVASSTVYTQAYDLTFIVDGIEVSPSLLDQGVKTIDEAKG